MVTNKFILCAALCLMPALANAAPSRMYCEVTRSDGAFANQMFFEVDGKSARVVDGIILNTSGKPIPAKISEDSSKKITMTWDVMLTNGRGQQTKMAYRAAVLKGTNKLLVSAKPHGYSNSFTARGRCQPMQGPLPGS